jgi:hypothetical protein
MHNRGNYDKFYETDTIDVPGHRPIMEQDYLKFKNNPKKVTPIKLSIELFQKLLRSHSEMLHHVHNMIQKTILVKKYGIATGESGKT